MKTKPNILIILCDQLRPFELKSYGGDKLKTPNIDALAKKSMIFDIACTSNPVCTPARSSLISGQYSRTCTGMLGNVDEPVNYRSKFPNPTIAELLKDVGYETALIGKWHMDTNPKLMGFDYTIYPKVHHLNTNQTFFDGDGKKFTAKGFAPDFEFEEIKKTIDEKKDKPFFMFYNISLPHMPYFDVPDKYKSIYSQSEIKLRANTFVDGKLAYDENWFKIYMYDYLYYKGIKPEANKLPEGFDLKTLTAMYYGMISVVDDQIGRVMSLLEKKGISDDTLVVFASDHGDNLGSHGLFNKDHIIEESIRIPMMFSLENVIKKGVNKKHIAQITDIYPTILELIGIEKPGYVQGRNLLPILKGEKDKLLDNYVFIESPNHEICIRTLKYKYGMLISPKDHKIVDDSFCLYNLIEDPFEENNLIDKEKNSKIAICLKEKLIEWNNNTKWL